MFLPDFDVFCDLARARFSRGSVNNDQVKKMDKGNEGRQAQFQGLPRLQHGGLGRDLRVGGLDLLVILLAERKNTTNKKPRGNHR